jgi:zinc-ribbon family
MIIYGRSSSHLKTIQLNKEKCPHCGTEGSLIMSTYSRYAHIFWIPFFPLGRSSATQCQHCKQVLEAKQMPASIRQHHEVALVENRIPIWQFSGLALVAFFTIGMIYSNKRDKEEQANFLQVPISGDVYEVKTDQSNYTLFKIASVMNDSIVVSYNKFEVNLPSGLNKIDKVENYSDTLYVLSTLELKKLFDEGKINDINRETPK